MLSTFDFMKESMLTYVYYNRKFKVIIAFYVYVFQRMPHEPFPAFDSSETFNTFLINTT